MKEVICISEQYKRFYYGNGRPAPYPTNKPLKDVIYYVDEVKEHNGINYYHIPGLDEDGDRCFWDSKLFADISNLTDEIQGSLRAGKPIKVYIGGDFLKEIIPTPTRSQHQEPDWLSGRPGADRWLHIDYRNQ